MDVILQRDDYQCGIWDHAITKLFYDYAKTQATGGFESWLWSMPRGFAPLGKHRTGSAARRTQGEANDSFIVSLRGEMRETLARADDAGKMPWQVAQHTEFARDAPADETQLDAIDYHDDDDGACENGSAIAAQLQNLKQLIS